MCKMPKNHGYSSKIEGCIKTQGHCSLEGQSDVKNGYSSNKNILGIKSNKFWTFWGSKTDNKTNKVN